jgi:hypothetical protein
MPEGQRSQTMTRKNYVALAAAIKYALDQGPFYSDAIVGVHRAIQAIADVLEQDNPAFDRQRFLKNAGVQS